MNGVNGKLIAANVVVFGLQQLYGPQLVPFELWPLSLHSHAAQGPQFEPWQLISYAFMHGGVAHLGLNMFALWMFGRDCESALGARRYAMLYLAAVLSAAGMQLAFSTIAHSRYPTVGASGGIFGVLLTFAVLYPNRRIMLLFPPIPMPAWLFVTLYGFIELANGVLGTDAGVAHFAHLGGMLGAALLLNHWRHAAR